MKINKVSDESRNGVYQIFSHQNVENVNPYIYYRNYLLKTRANLLYELVKLTRPDLAEQPKEFYIKNAAKLVDGMIEKFEGTKLNTNLSKLLSTKRKKDQLVLLKGMSITIDDLLALTFQSYRDFGYLHSRYLFEVLPSDVVGKTLPNLLYLEEDGTLVKIGHTDLTNGQLKNVIEHRKVVVSQFFEKGEVWHCFFITYSSIAGKEGWKNGQAHYHYISSAFGVAKDKVIESMRTGNYLSTPVHIDLTDYGNQSTV